MHVHMEVDFFLHGTRSFLARCTEARCPLGCLLSAPAAWEDCELLFLSRAKLEAAQSLEP